MEPLETIEIDEDNRIVVYYDETASNPIEETGVPVEHYVTRAGYNSVSDTPTGEFSEAFARFNDALDDPLSAMRRYLVIFHDWSEERAESQVTVYHHTGYSQSDWAELFVIVPDTGYGTAEGWAKEWSAWAQGDVYGVVHEVRERWINAEDDTEEMSLWNQKDALWGNYLDQDYTALDVARENFGVELPGTCLEATEHLAGQDHRWQECPVYHTEED